jgi:hypothetical protein
LPDEQVEEGSSSSQLSYGRDRLSASKAIQLIVKMREREWGKHNQREKEEDKKVDENIPLLDKSSKRTWLDPQWCCSSKCVLY